VKALDELKLLGLPTTCVEHNISVMNDVLNSTKGTERQLRNNLTKKRENNLPLNYELATLYFDRRMLNTAEKHLLKCKDLSKTLVEIECNRRSSAKSAEISRECDARTSSRRGNSSEVEYARFDPGALERAQEKYSGIVDDIIHVKELEGMFCTLTEEVKVLPCLLSRFSQDFKECENWWTEIRTSDKLTW
jgi:hypothetical protein